TMGGNPDKLDMGHIMGFAADLKLDTQKFQDCVNGDKYKDKIQADVAEAMRVGANGTPAFVVGKSTGNGVDGELVVGAMPFGNFDKIIKDLQSAKEYRSAVLGVTEGELLRSQFRSLPRPHTYEPPPDLVSSRLLRRRRRLLRLRARR